MLEEIYLERREKIEDTIKQAIKNVESKMNKIEDKEIEDNRELFDKMEENYNIKLSSICKELYLQGFKDGAKLMKEIEEK